MMVLPTVIVPGYFARATEYTGLAAILRERGIPTSIVPIRKRDWIPTVGGRSIVPILRLLEQTVKQALAEHNAEQVNLVGHSAGGWIS
ncbi:MAG: lipase, partial [Kamptonema sp. SIO4C4]|nr:lipase [Kamptonema sp. SIO4C4]